MQITVDKRTNNNWHLYKGDKCIGAIDVYKVNGVQKFRFTIAIIKNGLHLEYKTFTYLSESEAILQFKTKYLSNMGKK